MSHVTEDDLREFAERDCCKQEYRNAKKMGNKEMLEIARKQVELKIKKEENKKGK